MLRCTLEGGLVHGGHTGAVVLSWETMDVNLQRDGANRRTEVKQTNLLHRHDRRRGERERRKKRFNVSSWL